MAALIARLDVDEVDWIGTSLGGHIGMELAARSGLADPPAGAQRLRRARVGRRAAAHRRLPAARDWRFDSIAEVEAHLREVYAPFGTLTDAQWRHLAEHERRAGRRAACASTTTRRSAARSRGRCWLDVVLWRSGSTSRARC